MIDNMYNIEKIRSTKHKTWLWKAYREIVRAKWHYARPHLVGANLMGADLRGLDLHKCNLMGANLKAANLRGTDLREANLAGANLEGADLYDANLWMADLHDADLSYAILVKAKLNRCCMVNATLSLANLRNADLWKSNLRNANLEGAHLDQSNLEDTVLWKTNLQNATLSGSNLKEATLWETNLRGAIMRKVILRNADLSEANLCGADLKGSELHGAILTATNLYATDLSNAEGIITQREFLDQFKCNSEGIIVYKVIGVSTYKTPTHWKIQEGAYLTETVNYNRASECASGVHFATRGWCEDFYEEELKSKRCSLWECLIEWRDISDVVVPYNTDGKARCSRLKLIKEVPIMTKEEIARTLEGMGFTDGVDVNPETSLFEYGVLRNPTTGETLFAPPESDTLKFRRVPILKEDVLEEIENLPDGFFNSVGITKDDYHNRAKESENSALFIYDINTWNGGWNQSFIFPLDVAEILSEKEE